MEKKRVLSIIITLVMVFSLTACGNSLNAPVTNGTDQAKTDTGTDKDTSAPSENKEATYVMNIGNVAGTDHPINVALRSFKAAVEERTNGDLTVDIYDNSVLGGELELLEQVNNGLLESAVEMGGSNWESYNGAADVALIPFLFKSVEDGRNAWNNTDFSRKFEEEIIKPNGATMLSVWESGMRHMTNNTRPIEKPEDMAGIAFRTSQNDMKLQMFDALDSSVQMIAFGELFSALQQGTVDGQENPLSNIESSSVNEVQKYLSMTGHMYDVCVFICNTAWYEGLPAEYQTILMEEAANARLVELEENDENVIRQRLEEKGMLTNEVDKDAFIEKMSDIWTRFDKEYGPEWIDLALAAQGLNR